MLSLTVHTKQQPEAVEQAADRFFHGSLGLESSARDGAMTFSGKDGFVTVEVTAGNGETIVDLTTREYDHFVREFARDLG